MTDQPSIQPDPDDDPYKTLSVPPPSFRERLLAAQQARANEIKASVSITPPVPAETPDSTQTNQHSSS